MTGVAGVADDTQIRQAPNIHIVFYMFATFLPIAIHSTVLRYCNAIMPHFSSLVRQITSREFVFFLDDDSVPEPGDPRAIREVFVADTAKRNRGGQRLLRGCGSCQPTWLWRLRFALRLVPRGEPGSYFSCGTTATWNGVEPFSGVKPVDVLHRVAMAVLSRLVFEKHRFSLFFSG